MSDAASKSAAQLAAELAAALTAEMTAAEARDALEKFLNWRNAKVHSELQWLHGDGEVMAPAKADSLKREYDAKILRRDQVLFCIAQMAGDEFRYSDIETLVRVNFPISNQGRALNVTTALSELADKATGIIKRNSKRDAYMFRHTMLRALIARNLRSRDGSETVAWA